MKKEDWKTDEVYGAIKDSTIDALMRYVEQGIPTGDFLRGVLTNNLNEAMGRADLTNRATLWNIVTFCYNEIPSACWGSEEKVIAWLNKFRENPVEDE